MKPSKWIFILFGMIGFSMLIGSAYMYMSTTQFVDSALQTNGVVVDLIRRESDGEHTYAPQVTFTTLDGEEITFISGSSANPPSFHEGESVDVLYLEETPEEAKINAFATLYTPPLIVGGIGLIFFLVGAITGSVFFRRKKQIEYLQQHGMRIPATVTQIEYRKNYKVNNKSPYRIWAEGTDPRHGTVSKFKSDNIWFNPKEFVKQGDKVEVIVHPQKNNVHYMETPFLPENGKIKNLPEQNPSIS
jgi:hypothetical protein